MIDWLWCRISCAAASSLRPGLVTSIDADGVVEWQVAKWMQARGSHDATVAVKPRAPQIELSGSPAKFLQGHNAFGSDDVVQLGAAMIRRALGFLGVPLTDDETRAVDEGRYELLRVDVNYSYRTGSRSRCLAWIRAAEQHGYLQHRGRGMLKGTTVVWGAKSRHWQLKAYCKGQEIEAAKHGLPAELVHRSELSSWCDDKLRIEAQFNARYLKELQLHVAARWSENTAALLHSSHLSKLALTGESTMRAAELEALPSQTKLVYEAWSAGADVRAMLPRATFYKRRAQLLAHGIDIAVAPANAQRNVVPLIRYIEAEPVAIPDFARGTNLYFDPARRSA